MRISIYCFLFGLIYSSAFSQDIKNIQGIISFKNNAINDAHIINKNSNTGTISNSIGYFEIPVKFNDSLYISHLNYQAKIIVITKENFSKRILEIELEEKVERLNEVVLEKRKSIFHVDKDILNYEVKVTAKSLNLPYAGTKKKKDEGILSIQSGAVVSLDNLINTLNGNNRRAKLLKKLSKEDKEIHKIRKHFSDDFFINSLHIKKDFIQPFLEFCKNDFIIEDFKSKNQIEFMNIIIRHSRKFLYKIENDNEYLTKN